MDGFDQLWHGVVYGISALAYLAAAIHSVVWFRLRLMCTGGRDERLYIKNAAYVQLVLFLSGALTFALAMTVFVDALTRLTHIPHVAALLTHWCSLVWDAAGVLVVLNWSIAGGITARIVLFTAAPFTAAAVVLALLFVAHRQPTDSVNYVAQLGAAWTGTAYLAAFLISIVLSRLITLYVVVGELRGLGGGKIRMSLRLIACESILFIVFAAVRSGMQAAVIEGYRITNIDWIPVTIAGFANLVLIAGYTYADFSGYRVVWRAWKIQRIRYSGLYDLWSDLVSACTGRPPSAQWCERLVVTKIAEKISERLIEIDDMLARMPSINGNMRGRVLVDVGALPTALENLSAKPRRGDDRLFLLADLYAERRRELGRPCLDEIPR